MGVLFVSERYAEGHIIKMRDHEERGAKDIFNNQPGGAILNMGRPSLCSPYPSAHVLSLCAIQQYHLSLFASQQYNAA